MIRGLRYKARLRWNEYLATLYDLSELSEADLHLLYFYGVVPKMPFYNSLAERHKRNQQKTKDVV